MEITELPLPGVCVIRFPLNTDERGQFSRIFCRQTAVEHKLFHDVEQVNFSFTREKGCVRGLHFQHPPFAEWKLVRCVSGAIFDVVIDLRKKSPTFRQHQFQTLDSSLGNALCIPPGFAHGFQSLSDNVELIYVHSQPYVPGSEGGVRYDDPLFQIKWPLPVTRVSERDLAFPLFSDAFGIEI